MPCIIVVLWLADIYNKVSLVVEVQYIEKSKTSKSDDHRNKLAWILVFGEISANSVKTVVGRPFHLRKDIRRS